MGNPMDEMTNGAKAFILFGIIIAIGTVVVGTLANITNVCTAVTDQVQASNKTLSDFLPIVAVAIAAVVVFLLFQKFKKN